MWQITRRRWLLSSTGWLGGAAMSGASTAHAEELPLYQLFKPRSAKQLAPRWAAQFKGFDQVVGYSALGHLFMRNSRDGAIALIYPYQANGKNNGVFKDVAEFERKILKDDYVDQVILLRQHVAAIRKLKGTLGPEQVYVATPYPFMGGSERPETYDKGDVWVFLDIVAQMQGL